MRRALRRCALLISVVMLLGLGPVKGATAQTSGITPHSVHPITIGETLMIASAAMSEERSISVYLPAGYAGGSERYPVLYLIDGGLDQDFLHVLGTSQLGAVWGRSQPVIVVGIATRDRRRELAGPTSDAELLRRYPTAGHSADFRRHIADEVIPLIDRRYRTNGVTGVLGESLAGLFIVETWLREPGLFDRYAAISPSLWWDNEGLLRAAPDLLARHSSARPPILIAPEDEGAALAATAERFLAVLPIDGSVCRAPQPYNHATIYHHVTPMVLQFLFPPAETPMAEFGFTVPCAGSGR